MFVFLRSAWNMLRSKAALAHEAAQAVERLNQTEMVIEKCREALANDKTRYENLYRIEVALRNSPKAFMNYAEWVRGRFAHTIPDYYRLIDAEGYPDYQPLVRYLTGTMGAVCIHPNIGWWRLSNGYIISVSTHLIDQDGYSPLSIMVNLHETGGPGNGKLTLAEVECRCLEYGPVVERVRNAIEELRTYWEKRKHARVD